MRTRPVLVRLALVSVSLLVIAMSDALADISFSTPLSILVQDSPVGAVIADFDGNGADIVAANLGSSSLSFVRGHGNGLFDAPVHIPIGARPRAVAAGHLDGDAHLDLVATQDEGSPSLLAILHGNGTGGFSAPARMGIPGFPTALVARDLDGDGDCDLACALAGHTSINGGSIAVFLNHGGAFVEAITPVADVELVYAADLQAADLDGDLDPDLVVTLALFTFSAVMMNDGSGGFTAGPVLATSDISVANAVGDVDGDADNDVVVAGLNGTLTVFLNSGTGAFSRLSSQAAPTVIHVIGRFGLADLDGDTRPDLAMPDPGVPNAGLATMRNAGAGVFTFEERFAAAGGQVPTSVTIGDLDGAFPPDAVVADRGAHRLFVYLGSARTSVAGSAIDEPGMRCFPSPLRPGEPLSIVVPGASTTRSTGETILRIVDVQGRLIRQWRTVDGAEHTITRWDGRDEAGRSVPAGVYFVSAWRGHGSESARIVIAPR